MSTPKIEPYVDNTGTDADSSFLLSRKNIVGVVIALLVIVMHVTVGLGFLWPLVAVCGWGAGVLLTPKKKPKPIDPATLPTEVVLRRSLQATMGRLSAGEVPDKVLAKATELQRSAQYVLGNWEDLEGEPKHQLTMSDIISVYFPQVVSDYVEVPNIFHPDAVDSVIQSLDALTHAVERIRNAMVQHSLDTLSSNAKLLEQRFSQPSLQQTIENNNGEISRPTKPKRHRHSKTKKQVPQPTEYPSFPEE